MRTFEHFPQPTHPNQKPCPLCGTHDDKPCVLVQVDGTERDRICEAQPVHVACFTELDVARYRRDMGVIYLWCKEESRCRR